MGNDVHPMVTEKTNWSVGQQCRGPRVGSEEAVLLTLAFLAAAISIAGIAILAGPAATALFALVALGAARIHSLRGRHARRNDDDLRTAVGLMAGQITAAESELERMESLLRSLGRDRAGRFTPAGVSTEGTHAGR